MTKKREFASDSDVSKFISKKQNTTRVVENKKKGFSIYPNPDIIAQVKILAKINDKTANDIFLQLIEEALSKEQYQRQIQIFKQMQLSLNF